MENQGVDELLVKRSDLGLSTQYLPAKDDTESRIVEIWKTVLNVDSVGTKDDFFELGGDSLATTILAAQLEAYYNSKFRPSDILKYSTVYDQAIYLKSQNRENSDQHKTLPSYINLVNANGSKKTLFVIHGGIGFTTYGKSFLNALEQERPIGFLDAPGLDGKTTPLKHIEDYAEAYLRAIREVEPDGGWLIAASCAGSFIGLEICNQAERHGEKVSKLILIDPSYPDKKVKKRFKIKYKKIKRGCINLWLSLTHGRNRKRNGDTDHISAGSYMNDMLLRSKRQIRVEQNIRYHLYNNVDAAIPRTGGYRADDMLQVALMLQKACMQYRPGVWYGKSYILSNGVPRSKLESWQQCLPSAQVTTVNYDHQSLFREGLHEVISFISAAVNDEKVF